MGGAGEGDNEGNGEHLSLNLRTQQEIHNRTQGFHGALQLHFSGSQATPPPYPIPHASRLPPPLRLLLPPLPRPRQYVLPVLVHLQLRDHHLAGVHPDQHALPVRLLARHALDVDYVFEAVDGGDGAFAAFVAAAHDGDFVVFADGDGSHLLGVVGGEKVRDEGGWWGEEEGKGGEGRTLCFSRSSLLRGALMMVRRTLEGAVKWALRDLRREQWRSGKDPG